MRLVQAGIVAAKVGFFVAKETVKFTCKKVTQMAKHKGATQAPAKAAQVGKQLIGGKIGTSILDEVSTNCAVRKKTVEFLFRNWSRGTFNNRMQSIKYHITKHGKGRSYGEYTEAATNFFNLNRNKGTELILKNGKRGIAIKTSNEGKK